jgi:hypothetical protein
LILINGTDCEKNKQKVLTFVGNTNERKNRKKTYNIHHPYFDDFLNIRM